MSRLLLQRCNPPEPRFGANAVWTQSAEAILAKLYRLPVTSVCLGSLEKGEMKEFLVELVKDAPALSAIIAALAFAIAAGTFLKGVLEYRNQNALKRFEKFAELEERLLKDDIYHICFLLETNSPELRDIERKERQKFLGFYEQIAIMHNSKIIRSDIAHYMFGYYAIRCYGSDHFWHDMDRESGYWALFKVFAVEMRKMDAGFPGNLCPKKLRA